MLYHWKNLETGGEGVRAFDAVQHSFFGCPGIPYNTLSKIADELIATWNAQQPKTWFYWRDKNEQDA